MHGVGVNLALRGSRLALTASYREADFGFGPLGNRGGTDIYFARLDLDGNVIHAIALGSAESDHGLNLASQPNGWITSFFLAADFALGNDGTILPPGSHLLWLDEVRE